MIMSTKFQLSAIKINKVSFSLPVYVKANDPFRLVTCCLISNILVDFIIILKLIEIKKYYLEYSKLMYHL